MAKIIDISSIGPMPETGGPSNPVNSGVVELLYNMYDICLTKKSHAEAAETLYLMEKCLRKNNVTDEELLSLPDKVTEYFAKRNATQPSPKPEGFFNGRQGSRYSYGEEESYTDGEIALALSRLVGKDCVINQKRKWAGAYWCLRWTCDYPVEAGEFCDRIASLRLNLPSGYECCYENIRKLCTLSFMGYDFHRMDRVRCSDMDREDFAMCRQVALSLEAELRRTHRGE